MSVAEYAWLLAALCFLLTLVRFLKWEGWLLTVVWVAFALWVA